MATHERPQVPGLSLLEAQAEETSFFQLARALEALTRTHGMDDETTPELLDDVRYAAENTSAFRPNYVEALSLEGTGLGCSPVARVRVNGFSLTGMQGPLPSVYSEQLYQADSDLRDGPQAFINLFNDRLLHYLYRVKKRLDPALFNDTQDDGHCPSLFRAITGVAQPGDEARFDSQPDEEETGIDHLITAAFGPKWLRFAPLIANRRVNYSLVRNLLLEAFGLPVEVDPCHGGWHELPRHLRAKVGVNARLGSGVGLGSRYWRNDSYLAVTFTADSLETARGLLPEGESHEKLCRLLRFVTDGAYGCRVTVNVAWDDVPLSELRRTSPPLLGQISWIKTNSEGRDDIRFPTFTVEARPEAPREEVRGDVIQPVATNGMVA